MWRTITYVLIFAAGGIAGLFVAYVTESSHDVRPVIRARDVLDHISVTDCKRHPRHNVLHKRSDVPGAPPLPGIVEWTVVITCQGAQLPELSVDFPPASTAYEAGGNAAAK